LEKKLPTKREMEKRTSINRWRNSPMESTRIKDKKSSKKKPQVIQAFKKSGKIGEKTQNPDANAAQQKKQTGRDGTQKKRLHLFGGDQQMAKKRSDGGKGKHTKRNRRDGPNLLQTAKERGRRQRPNKRWGRRDKKSHSLKTGSQPG